MIRCIIFDLSEVLIAGLVGIEKILSRELSVPEEGILPCFGGEPFEELLVGNISEDTYLRHIAAREMWDVSIARLKAVIRDNFHHEVEGALPILMDLASRHELALLSDHAREWIAYIQSIHPFLKIFQHKFFSYELKKTKRDPASFLQVLDAMSLAPRDCLFIDDSPTNVHVAESVGIPSIRFVSAERLADELGKRQERLAHAEAACAG